MTLSSHLPARTSLLLPLLGLATAVLFAFSLLIGPANIGIGQALDALLTGRGDATVLVMREIRLPRTLLASMIGASLGLCGAALQGYLRNPLAEPGIIGISGAASLGAVIAVYTGLSASFALALPLSALAAAFVAVMTLLAIASGGGTLTLILAGIAMTSMASALTSLALNLSPNPFASLEIVFWLLGSLKDRSMEHVALAVPFTLAGWALLLTLGRALDALTLGEDAAATLGVRLPRLRLQLVAGVALVVGSATAVAGSIGFVGLIVPHVMRPLCGYSPSRLLAASALGGAVLLLAADIAVRIILTSRELQLGVLTALIGAPFFLFLVLKTRRTMA